MENIFDAKLKHARYLRAQSLLNKPQNNNLQQHFIISQITNNLAERLADINKSYRKALDLWPIGCEAAIAFSQQDNINIEEFHLATPSDLTGSDIYYTQQLKLPLDNENLAEQPLISEHKYDLIVSAAGLAHYVENLPNFLRSLRQIMNPDGLMIIILWGENTLKELKISLAQAESDLSGGIAPRFAPVIATKDAGRLIQGSGFDMPVADSEIITIEYESLAQLIADIRMMGQTNFINKKSNIMPHRKLFTTTEEIYWKNFATNNNRITASFEIITITGWYQYGEQESMLSS